jgi:hypothetical protein
MTIRCVHYVGFRDDRYLTAYRAFGGPAFIHRAWDRRARREIDFDNDLIIFANGPHDQPVKDRNGDDLRETVG